RNTASEPPRCLEFRRGLFRSGDDPAPPSTPSSRRPAALRVGLPEPPLRVVARAGRARGGGVVPGGGPQGARGERASGVPFRSLNLALDSRGHARGAPRLEEPSSTATTPGANTTMTTHAVPLIPGDGIGPALTQAPLRVLPAT